MELFGHSGDVVAMSVNPNDENLLLTGSVDKTAKLWDLRTKSFQQTFWGHEADVNAVFVSLTQLELGIDARFTQLVHILL